MKTKNREWVLSSRCGSRCSFFCSRIIPAFSSRETCIKNVITRRACPVFRFNAQHYSVLFFIFPFCGFLFRTYICAHVWIHKAHMWNICKYEFLFTTSNRNYLFKLICVPSYYSVTRETNISRIRENM